MAVKILSRTYTAYECGDVCEILTDTEAEIQALGREVSDGYTSVKVAPGSIARVAGFGAMYELSPSGVWVKG